MVNMGTLLSNDAADNQLHIRNLRPHHLLTYLSPMFYIFIVQFFNTISQPHVAPG